MPVAPSTAVTPDDHGAIAEVAAAFCTCIALLFLCTRLLVRWPWSRLFGKDDIVICVASVFCVVQMILVLCASSAGVGRKSHLLTHSDSVYADKLLYASGLVYTLTLYLSRAAIVCFFFRLENSHHTSYFVKSLMYTCVALTVCSLVVLATQQYQVSHWTLPSTANANGLFARWAAVEIVGDVFELCLLVYPVWLVRRLQMRMAMKVKVVTGVASRAPLLIISALRVYYIHQSLTSDQYLFKAVDFEVLTQVEMSYALIAATIPTLQIFLRAAKSAYLGETVHTQAGSQALSYGKGTAKNNSRVVTSKVREGTQRSIELSEIAGGKTTTVITKGGSCARSLASDSSERAIVMHHTVDIQSDVGRQGSFPSNAVQAERVAHHF